MVTGQRPTIVMNTIFVANKRKALFWSWSHVNDSDQTAGILAVHTGLQCTSCKPPLFPIRSKKDPDFFVIYKFFFIQNVSQQEAAESSKCRPHKENVYRCYLFAQRCSEITRTAREIILSRVEIAVKQPRTNRIDSAWRGHLPSGFAHKQARTATCVDSQQ